MSNKQLCFHFVLSILADFWSRYEVVYGKLSTEEETTDDNYNDEEEEATKKLPIYHLKVFSLYNISEIFNNVFHKDDFGIIRLRSSPAVLHYYIDKRDDYEKIR